MKSTSTLCSFISSSMHVTLNQYFMNSHSTITEVLLLCALLIGSDGVWEIKLLRLDRIDKRNRLAYSIDELRGLLCFASTNTCRMLRRDSCKNVTIVDASISSNPRLIETNDSMTRTKRNATKVGKKRNQLSGLTKLAGAFALFPSALEK